MKSIDDIITMLKKLRRSHGNITAQVMCPDGQMRPLIEIFTTRQKVTTESETGVSKTEVTHYVVFEANR